MSPSREPEVEVDALSGAVVRRDLTHGIPTPVHQAIAACLSLHQPATPAPTPLAHDTGHMTRRQHHRPEETPCREATVPR